MLGAIAGDIIGSVYEARPIKTTQFPLFGQRSWFTDDTVMTVAVAQAILHNSSYKQCIRYWGQKYPNAGYGGFFVQWLFSEDARPYNSWGNGSAMRVSPIGFAFDTMSEVLQEARKAAEITHNHPEGVKGAQATAAAIFLARTEKKKSTIKAFIGDKFGYDLDRTLDQIRPLYTFDVSCQGTVPEAIISFLESENFEDAIRKAISLGGDSDTLACITGGIAEAYYGKIPKEIVKNVERRLTPELMETLHHFRQKYF